MNEIIKAMIERRSVRKYRSDMIPRDIIDEIIEAGLYAASGKNFQGVKIIAVTDKKTRDELSKLNCSIGRLGQQF